MATAKAAAEAEAPAKVASGKVVKYVGTADSRSIDAASWRSIGVEDQARVTWDKDNKFAIPVADLTAPAVKYLDEDDAGFVVTDADT